MENISQTTSAPEQEAAPVVSNSEEGSAKTLFDFDSADELNDYLAAEKQEQIEEEEDNVSLHNEETKKDVHTLLEYAPPEVRKSYKHLQAEFTKKSQEAAELRKMIQQLKEEQEHQSKLLFDPERGHYKRIEEKIQKGKDAEEYSDDWLESKMAEIEKRRLEPLIKEHQRTLRLAQMEAFAAKHPDLQTDSAVREGVKQTILEARKQNKNITTEEAYYMVKGRMAAQSQNKYAEQRQKDREALKKIGSGVRAPAKIKFSDKATPYEIYQTLARKQGGQ